MNNTMEIILGLIVLGILVVFIVCGVWSMVDCVSNGGVFVKGVPIYSCVERD